MFCYSVSNRFVKIDVEWIAFAVEQLWWCFFINEKQKWNNNKQGHKIFMNKFLFRMKWCYYTENTIIFIESNDIKLGSTNRCLIACSCQWPYTIRIRSDDFEKKHLFYISILLKIILNHINSLFWYLRGFNIFKNKKLKSQSRLLFVECK